MLYVYFRGCRHMCLFYNFFFVRTSVCVCVHVSVYIYENNNRILKMIAYTFFFIIFIFYVHCGKSTIMIIMLDVILNK